MTTIVLETPIHASPEKGFDLSRSLDLHMDSMRDSAEKAIAGRTSGLIGLDETVTWRARHFGWWHTMTIRITQFRSPEMFRDEMVAGPFKCLNHDHLFDEAPEGTIMTDIFCYELPFHPLSRFIDIILIRRYMTRLLLERNRVIKQLAES